MHAMYAGQKLEEVHTLGSAALRDWMISRLTGYGMKFTKDAVEHAYGPECFVRALNLAYIATANYRDLGRDEPHQIRSRCERIH